MSRQKKKSFVNVKKVLGAFGAFFILVVGFSNPVKNLVQFPDKISLSAGQSLTVPWTRWLPVSVQVESPAWAGSKGLAVHAVSPAALKIWAPSGGHYFLHVNFLGWQPWNPVPVDVTKPIKVVPGGESLGVVVNTRGLVVTGFSTIEHNGRLMDPARDAGIDRGDVILRANNRPLRTDQQLESLVNRAGKARKPVIVDVSGARHIHRRTVWPAWSHRYRRYQIGVLVQDHASGVGTLTFYTPRTHRYTALGHSITDGLTRRPVGVAQGKIMGANIVGIVPGSRNRPGQKIGVLAQGHALSGSVQTNGQFGIRGILFTHPLLGFQRPMPLAYPDQVHPGKAQIVTVLRGQTPHRYSIEILKTTPQATPSPKGLLFKVTDPRLLRETGGIVQGMSGSPIIEDGKLVGAVTHVLVSQPTLGFGCYAYWMYREG